MIINLLSKLSSKIKDIDPEDILYTIRYLNQYGYLNNITESIEDFVSAVKKFQEFFDLKQDGILDDKTLNELRQPRCSMPDFISENSSQYKWNKDHITYYIKSRVRNIHPDDYDGVIDECAKDCMSVCGIKISRTNSTNADLILDTGSSRRDELGTPGNVLGWAYLPMGDNRQLLMKLDLAENWTININEAGIYLKSVIGHEAFSGHMMGLSHHNNRCALLFPQYQKHISTPQTCYEIPQLQDRYGKPQNNPEPDPEPDPPSKETIIKIKGNIENIEIAGYRVNKLS